MEVAEGGQDHGEGYHPLHRLHHPLHFHRRCVPEPKLILFGRIRIRDFGV